MLGRMLREWPLQAHVRFLARLLGWEWHSARLSPPRSSSRGLRALRPSARRGEVVTSHKDVGSRQAVFPLGFPQYFPALW